MEGADRKAKGASDLGVRTASAIVMVVVAGTAFWLGGWAWIVFVGVVAAVTLWEWRGLALGFASNPLNATAWNIGGVVYIGFATAFLMFLREGGGEWVLMLIAMVIATDIGAYFAGRTFGGPKIAPGISPSKTWSGLIGGTIACGCVIAADAWFWPNGLCQWYFGTFDPPYPVSPYGFDDRCSDATPLITALPGYVVGGAPIAVIAQAGDFFESWMKRRAGVKDSSKLIPGHGGLFDRIDGLLAVAVAFGFFYLVIKVKNL